MSDSYPSCCIDFYQLPITQFLLGDSFHPGGLKLTKQLAQQLLIGRDSRVLDIASGRGTSSLYLAEQFGCQVVALDLSENNLEYSRVLAKERNLSSQITTTTASAENLPFESNSFDAIICECAVCTFENPQQAVNEMFRVLKPNAKVGISDVVLNKELPCDLNELLSKIFCISGALSNEQYIEMFKKNGFSKIKLLPVNWAITEVMDKIKKQTKLLNTISGKVPLSIPDWLMDSNVTLNSIEDFVKQEGLGYMMMTAKKSIS